MKVWRMQLNEIQDRFKNIILGFPATLEKARDGVFEAAGVPLSERLKIYHNNFMGSVSAALMDNFPLLEKLVGRDFLTVMTRAYIRNNPPRSGCLTFYGDDYDRFISTYTPAAALPYLPDMATLEILINRSYHARDDKPLTASDLAEISAVSLEAFHMKLRDNVQLLRSRWPLAGIRRMCMESGNKTLDIFSGGACLLIHRPHLAVEITEISSGEFMFLKQLKMQPLGKTVEETMSTHPDFDFSTALPRLMAMQIFLKELPS